MEKHRGSFRVSWAEGEIQHCISYPSVVMQHHHQQQLREGGAHFHYSFRGESMRAAGGQSRKLGGRISTAPTKKGKRSRHGVGL